jgi:hypothetical protein
LVDERLAAFFVVFRAVFFAVFFAVLVVLFADEAGFLVARFLVARFFAAPAFFAEADRFVAVAFFRRNPVAALTRDSRAST